MLTHAPEVRAYLPVGPVEFRLTGRYYIQNAASFTSLVNGQPAYASGVGKPCGTCLSSSSRSLYYTSDPKLYAWDSFFLEGRLAFSLRGLGQFKKLPLHDWLAGGVIELSYGHYFDNKVAQLAYGDADLAGLSFRFRYSFGVSRGYLVLDIETIPDADLYEKPETADGVAAPFPPLYAHKPIVIGVLWLDEIYSFKRIGVIGENKRRSRHAAGLRQVRRRLSARTSSPTTGAPSTCR